MLALHPSDFARVGMVLTILNSKYISNQNTILTPNQILQRLSMALSQVKTGSTSENLLDEIKQIIYSLYQEKEITKTTM